MLLQSPFKALYDLGMDTNTDTHNAPGPNRIRALEMLAEGKSVREVARVLDLSLTRVYQFINEQKEAAS